MGFLRSWQGAIDTKSLCAAQGIPIMSIWKRQVIHLSGQIGSCFWFCLHIARWWTQLGVLPCGDRWHSQIIQDLSANPPAVHQFWPRWVWDEAALLIKQTNLFWDSCHKIKSIWFHFKVRYTWKMNSNIRIILSNFKNQKYSKIFYKITSLFRKVKEV